MEPDPSGSTDTVERDDLAVPTHSAGAHTHSLADATWQSRYTSSSDDLVRDFFAPVLAVASRYDRAVAYFRSSFYSLSGSAVAAFALSGGKVRLLCSPDLTESDLVAIVAGDDNGTVLREAALRELRRIAEAPGAADGMAVFEALVAVGAIEIRLAAMRDGSGVFHDKVGVLKDADGNVLSFVGSANETWSAWSGHANHESFEVFCSWLGDEPRVREHAEFFEYAWAGRLDRVAVVTATDAIREGLVSLSAPEEGLDVLRAAVATPEGAAPRAAGPPLFPHQEQALQSWRAAGRRGILKHATGSGKTITALEAIREQIARGRPALVLVPSILLLEQWHDVASDYLRHEDPTILRAGGGHNAWRKPGILRSQMSSDIRGPRLTLATLQTAVSEAFQRSWIDSDDLLVVCDEVHRFGAPGYEPLGAHKSGPRLGLSATPERFRDPDGTKRIQEFFGPVLDPIVSLRDAIEWGRLVPYEYRFEVATLTEDEVEAWNALTDRIARALGGAEDLSRLPPQVKTLLIQRSRIAKKAVSKASLAASVVKERFHEGEHWLVYCEDSEQLRQVRQSLADAKVDSLEYRSEMRSNHAAVLERFERLGGVLVSIRCLDEGIDIPVISHAVILASSQNPREYIQRRGRVLRTSPGKRRAQIHDVLVLPPRDNQERFASLVLSEVARAHEFAKDAQNASAALLLESLAIEWGVDLTAIDLDDISEEPEEGLTDE